MRDALIERFFRYVKIDTQSQEEVGDRYPSTEKQKDLGRLLVQELQTLGLTDAAMDGHGYVTATLPSNLPASEAAKVPVIGLLAHMDTSPEVSGKNVKPQIHAYKGGDIIIGGDPPVVLRADENPDLGHKIGHEIITASGDTLLGADNKAGIAEIMTLLAHLQAHPEVPHGTVKIGFTPDEEVGTGTLHFDVQQFGADFAYTVDGEKLGEVENETFNAAAATFKITGVGVHPGYAKGKLVNATRIASEIVAALADDPAPETTEGRQGYIHPYVMNGGAYEMTVKLLLRDFELEGIEEKSRRLQALRDEVAARYPKAVIQLEVQESYRNMRLKLDGEPRVMEYAMEAVRRTGVEPHLQIIRGGTDGARLSYKGLLTPNLFTGGHNFHSNQEWISIQDMEKAVETLIQLVQVWVEKSR